MYDDDGDLPLPSDDMDGNGNVYHNWEYDEDEEAGGGLGHHHRDIRLVGRMHSAGSYGTPHNRSYDSLQNLKKKPDFFDKYDRVAA